MGLFSRNKPKNTEQEEIFDEADLPSSSDINDNLFADDGKVPPSFPAQPTSKTLKPKYNVEDAIALMRNLPKDNNDVVVTVVKKTLESTDIKVADIIKDAETKESRLREQHKALEQDIKGLQERIAQKNQRITELLADLKETTNVKQRLQLALEIEHKAQKPQAPATFSASPLTSSKAATQATPAPTSRAQASTSRTLKTPENRPPSPTAGAQKPPCHNGERDGSSVQQHSKNK